jgi:hypothetical protein
MRKILFGIVLGVAFLWTINSTSVDTVAKEPVMKEIPRAYGRLVSVTPHTREYMSRLWFEDASGTVRMVVVWHDAGKKTLLKGQTDPTLKVMRTIFKFGRN